MAEKNSDGSRTVSGVRQARLTGLVYLLYFIAGMPLLLRSSLVVRGDAAATADHILGNQLMYRMTIVTDLVSYILYLALAYLFYTLLRRVSRSWTVMGTLFTIAGCIVLIVATSTLAAPLLLLRRRPLARHWACRTAGMGTARASCTAPASSSLCCCSGCNG
jgi:uncharacterized BrkB/YihY/UPF0761 family membrane protein